MFPSAQHLDLVQRTLATDLSAFLPELTLAGGIVLLLLARLVKAFDRGHLAPAALAIVAVALALACYQAGLAKAAPNGPASTVLFGGMLLSDPFSLFGRILVLTACLLTVLLTAFTGIPDREDSGDLYVLLLGGTLGMMLMTEANHLLMVFLAVEMASLPSYAMAGFLKGRRQGSEAALKYVVYGAAASGVMLYGISLLAGATGTGRLPDVATFLNEHLREGAAFDPLAATGLAFLFIGLGFKLAAVPFHFWCPDVFAGAAAEVAGFLSVASKAAAITLTARLLMLLHGVHGIGVAVGIAAAVTVTFGNLAAFGQTNLKRLLAYSTIAHAGYMLLALATLRHGAVAAVLFYLTAYIVMNLGAFTVVALVRNRTGSEELDAFRGLAARAPVLAVTFTIFLLALLGLPPLGGFAGKFQVFAVLLTAGREALANGQESLGQFYFVLLGIGALNTAASAYYYLKVVRVLMLEEPPAGAADRGTESPLAQAYLAAFALALFAIGIVWNPLLEVTTWAAG